MIENQFKRWIFIACLLGLTLFVQSQDYFNHEENRNKKHLVIVHPTQSNLERYTYLIEEGYLDPGKLKLVGVYYENENYDYSAVIENYPDVGFHELKGELPGNNLFQENDLTKEFRLIFNYSRGIIFNGGPDIPPFIYGEEMNLLTSVRDPYRHYFEVSFLFHLLGGSRNTDFKPFMRKRPKYSVLGICLGMQTMNVAAGGTLYQDIPTEIYDLQTVEQVISRPENTWHRNYYTNFRKYDDIRSYFLHRIELLPGRWFHRNLKIDNNLNPLVFSSHHQAIDKLGENFRIAASSMDGKIIEAIEHTRYSNVIGIQFHPEVDYLFNEEKKYRSKPDEPKKSFKNILIKENSMEFHREFWQIFSKNL